MDDFESPTILHQYENLKPKYVLFAEKLEHLIYEILNSNSIHFHYVTSRVKDKTSIENKIIKSQGKYKSISDITDIIGIRILTYFSDDVDKIASLIEDEFVIDRENSIDKRKLLAPDRFGYLSLHYIVALSHHRWNLTEYSSFKSFKAEIQIRSLLQHTWAEIVHDFGYKSTYSVPKAIYRQFCRLAGLLELADQEFVTIRNELTIYEKSLPEKIDREPATVSLDIKSFEYYLYSSQMIHDLDEKIIRDCLNGRAIYQSDKNAKIIDKLINLLTHFNLISISEVEQEIKNKSKLIFNFAELWLKNDSTDALVTIPMGFCLKCLIFLLGAERYNRDSLIDFLNSFSLIDPDELEVKSNKIINIYSAIIAT